MFPPSVETSTLDTPEPVPSEAVPETVTLAPFSAAPEAGPVMLEAGGVLSTVTATPTPTGSMLPEKSVARVLMVYGPSDGVLQE